MSSIKAPPTGKVIAAQLLVILGLSLSALLFFDSVSAYSVLTGGLINAVPNAYFASKVFRYRGARAAQKIVRELYTGEAVKLLLIGSGFALSFLYIKPLNIAALFSGFVLVHITGILMFVRVSKPSRNNP
jgi:ATP synthase protein I